MDAIATNGHTNDMLTPSESASELVQDLATAFETALHLYGQWKSRRERSNHYRKPGTMTLKTISMTKCALTTSLSLGARIQETFSIGAAILGHPFIQGDSSSRRTLTCQRDFLIDQIVTLKQAASADAVSGPLDINAILLTSETARTVSIQALVDQYRRIVASHRGYEHGFPKELPTLNRRAASLEASRGDEAKAQNTQLQAPRHARSFPVPSNTPLTNKGLTPPPPPRPALPPQPVQETQEIEQNPILDIPQTFGAPSARWLTYLEDDNRTTAWSVLSGPLVFQSEPPSPPLTPKELAALPPVPPLPQEYRLSAVKLDGVAKRTAQRLSQMESAYNCDGDTNIDPLSSASAKTGTSLVRPKNSVFHIFCPEAMALQVDLRRPVPTTRKCRCGFRWEFGDSDKNNNSISSLQSGKSIKSVNSQSQKHVLQLKEGFGMSRRFLAKSHCEPNADGGSNGYGCVLCTSSGLAQTYETAEDLRVHINAAHDKWQMLHDRDLV